MRITCDCGGERPHGLGTKGDPIIAGGGGVGTGAALSGGLEKQASVPASSFYVYFWEDCWRQKSWKRFFGLPKGKFFVLPYRSKLKMLRILWRIQKWVKNTKKPFLTPQPGLRVGPWLMGAWVDGQIFLKKAFTPFVYVQNDQGVMGIIDHFEVRTWGYPLTAPKGPRWLSACPWVWVNEGGGGDTLRGGEGPPPPLQPMKWLNTHRGRVLAGSSPRVPCHLPLPRKAIFFPPSSACSSSAVSSPLPGAGRGFPCSCRAAGRTAPKGA